MKRKYPFLPIKMYAQNYTNTKIMINKTKIYARTFLELKLNTQKLY